MTFLQYEVAQRAHDGLWVTWASRPTHEIPATLSSVWTAIGVSEDRQTAVNLIPARSKNGRKGD